MRFIDADAEIIFVPFIPTDLRNAEEKPPKGNPAIVMTGQRNPCSLV
jgi:hypothetical protein